MPFFRPTELASIDAGVVDDGVDHLARGSSRQLDRAAIGLERAVVLDQGVQRLAGLNVRDRARDLVADGKRQQLVAVEVEREAVAGGEADVAEPRR